MFNAQYPPPRVTPTIYVDGIGPGNTYSVPPQLTPYGRFHEPPEEANPNVQPWNVGAVAAGRYRAPLLAPPDERPMLNPGGPMVPYNGPQPSNLQRLIAQLAGSTDLPRHGGFLPPAPFQDHHQMVSAAQSLARLLAQQHTAGLRRYNGRF